MEEISYSVGGLKVKKVLVVCEWCRGVIEERNSDSGYAVLLRRFFVDGENGDFNVLDVGESGVF